MNQLGVVNSVCQMTGKPAYIETKRINQFLVGYYCSECDEELDIVEVEAD